MTTPPARKEGNTTLIAVGRYFCMTFRSSVSSSSTGSGVLVASSSFLFHGKFKCREVDEEYDDIRLPLDCKNSCWLLVLMVGDPPVGGQEVWNANVAGAADSMNETSSIVACVGPMR